MTIAHLDKKPVPRNPLTGNLTSNLTGSLIWLVFLAALPLAGCATSEQQKPGAAIAAPNPVLTVSGGQIQGVALATPSGASVYKGIPYAAAPTGARRWQAPQPVAAWSGVRSADKWGPACMQPSREPGSGGDGSKPGSVDYTREFYAAGDPEMSEDCLYLNVYTPAAGQTDARLPVALWLHGGGYTQGYSHEIEFDGAAYAQRDVILVTINYRLGALGYLYHPLLSAENEHHVSGNYGLLDQIAALDWVRENITQFGGNPDNITIFGQSAGAGSVQNMLVSPLTTGKIARAIIQSGGGLAPAHRPAGPTLAEMEKTAQEICAAADVTTLAQLRALSYTDLQTTLQNGMTKTKKFLRFAPIVDGYVVPMDFSTAVRTGKIPDIAYMIGSTKDDLGFSRDSQPVNDFSLELVKTGHKPAYIYRFLRELPGDKAGAFHSAELWFMFGTIDNCWRPLTAADRALSAKMLDYWTNFMKAGSPDGANLTPWPPYTPADPFIMQLDI